jgi:Leucine-rich repeat (LRR) protein
MCVFTQVLYEFENLEILYLHANHITNVKEVDKLGNFKKLKKLTLHGNEIEKEKVILK